MAFTVEMARKLSNVDPQLREVLFSVIEEVEQQRAGWERSVMKPESDELRAVVRDLAEAQKRTEARVEALAEAQKRAERTMLEGFQKLRDSIAALGSRWGVQVEDVFRRTIESLLARGGLRGADVDKLLASAKACEAKTGVRPGLMIASSDVPPSVMRRLLACGREIGLISHHKKR